jgi:hypothetical protein
MILNQIQKPKVEIAGDAEHLLKHSSLVNFGAWLRVSEKSTYCDSELCESLKKVVSDVDELARILLYCIELRSKTSDLCLKRRRIVRHIGR